jgi:hypothetical protein
VHDALIKNFRDELYDHAALAERWEFTENAKSATFRLLSRVEVPQWGPGHPRMRTPEGIQTARNNSWIRCRSGRPRIA